MFEDLPPLHFQAQHDEDRLLLERFGHQTVGYYVEVGAFDGVMFSNTYAFEELGWTGLLIEPNPGLAEHCRASRPGSAVVHCAVVAPGAPATASLEVSDDIPIISSLRLDRARVLRESGRLEVRRVDVPARTLDAVLEGAGAPRIDFVTIDVEGCERDVLRGFSLRRWRPRVLILERNMTLPDLWILWRLCRGGYGWERSTGCNDWFVPMGGAFMRTGRWYVSLLWRESRSSILEGIRRSLMSLGLWDRLQKMRGRRSSSPDHPD